MAERQANLSDTGATCWIFSRPWVSGSVSLVQTRPEYFSDTMLAGFDPLPGHVTLRFAIVTAGTSTALLRVLAALPEWRSVGRREER